MKKIKSFKLFESKDDMIILSKDIRKFIDDYANISPNYNPKYDDEDSKYTGPDVGMLLYAADLLSRGEKPKHVWSEWGSGCYGRYSDRVGRELHDSLLKRINEI